MAKQSLFYFMKDISSDLYELAIEIESRLYDHPATTLMKSRLYGEQLVKLVFEKEEIEENYPLKNVERIHRLYRDEIIEKDIYLKFEWIRKKGNEAAHEIKKVKLEDVFRAHRYIYDVTVWYMQVYVTYDFEPPTYDLPVRSSEKTTIASKEVDKLIGTYMNQTLEEIENIRKEMSSELKALKNEQLKVDHHTENIETPPKKELKPFPIIQYLNKHNLPYIDRRNQGGALWVLGDWSISDQLFALKKHKIYFRYRKQGGKASKQKPAWYLLNKTLPLSSLEIEDTNLTKEISEKKVPEQKDTLKIELVSSDYWIEGEQLFQPAHLQGQLIQHDSLNGMSYIQEQLLLKYYDDITEDVLRDVYRKSRVHFFHLMNELYVLGFRFTGGLASFQVGAWEKDEQKIKLKMSNHSVNLNELLPHHFVKQVEAYGINEVGDLDNMLVSSLAWILKKDIDEMTRLLLSRYENIKGDKSDININQRGLDEAFQDEQTDSNISRRELDETIVKDQRVAVVEDITNDKEVDQIEKHPEIDDRKDKKIDGKTKPEEALTLIFRGDKIDIEDEYIDVPIGNLGIKGCTHFINELIRENIVKLTDLPKKLDQIHERLHGVGPRTVEKFWEQLRDIHHLNPIGKEEARRDLLYYDGYTLQLPDYVQEEQLQAEDFPGSNQAIVTLQKNGIETFGDLASSFHKIGEFKGIGKKRIESIFASFKSLVKNKKKKMKLDQMPDDERLVYELNSFSEWYTEAHQCEETLKKDRLTIRYIDFVKRRYKAFLKDGHVTLEELAQNESITRERVRQILKQGDEQVVEKWITLTKLIQQKLQVENIILAEQIIEEMNKSYYLLFHALKIENIHLTHIHKKLVITNLNERELNEYVTKVEKETEKVFHKQIIKTEALRNYCQERAQADMIDEEIVYTIASHVVNWANETKGILKKTSKLDVVEMVMLQYPNGAEVYKNEPELIKKANDILPNGFAGERSFNSFLSRDDANQRFMLWNRGIYIHHKFIDINEEWVYRAQDEAANWLKDESFIHVRKIYDEMLEEQAKEKIPNEYALYSLMRYYDKGILSFERFPSVLPYGKERLENHEWIVKFIREKNRPVSVQELVKEFVEGKGWQRFTLEHNLSYSSNVISFKYGYYTLLERYEHIKEEQLSPILQKIRAELEKSSVVNIRVLFQQHDMYLKSNGIDTADVLYALVRKHLHEQLEYPRFPYIISEHFEGDSLATQHVVEQYLFEENRIVSREEAIKWLGDMVGMESAALDNALVVSKDIYYYTVGQYGEYVHRNTIGLTERVERQINELMLERYEMIKAKRNRPYVFLRELFDIDSLPPLPDYIPWNIQLLGDILKKTKKWTLIGSYGEILLPVKSEIEDEIQFIEFVLQHEFEGAVKLLELKSYLRKIRYSSDGDLLHAVKVSIEENKSPFIISGDELIDRELNKR